MPVYNYLDASQASSVIYGRSSSYTDAINMKSFLTTNMSGIEGLPYQFMDSVDRRLPGTEVGRKYADKIISHLPLLFLTPCKQKFMDDFSRNDKEVIANSLIGNSTTIDSSLIEGSGRYYSVEFDYYNYFQYVNIMMRSVASFLGIGDVVVSINGKTDKLKSFNWGYAQNNDLKSFFNGKENVIFYLDSMTQVSESYSNSTTESSLASLINGFADNANEIKFLFGEAGGNLASFAMDTAQDITSSIGNALSGVASKLGGGIAGSLAQSGVNTVLEGGKIIFPKIWSDSQFDRSYSINFKLRSPDHDSLSIYLNVLKPYIMLLAFVLPRMTKNYDPNSYREPFLVKAYSKGMFNIDMGIISSMQVTRGDQCQWNDDGLPTQIDISIDIEDLYSSLIMSSQTDHMINVVKNTSFMDFLANMAGLNIGQMEIQKRIQLYLSLTASKVTDIPSNAFTRMQQSVSQLVSDLYDKL